MVSNGERLRDMSEANRTDRPAAPNRRRLLLAVAALAVVALAAGGWGIYRWQSQAHHASALASCQQSSTRLATELKKPEQKEIVEARTVQSEQVADSSVVTAFAAASKTDADANISSCDAGLSTEELQGAADRMNDAAQAREAWSRKASKVAKAVLDARNAKTLEDAKSALKAKQGEGSARLTQTEGQVADNSTREQLQQALDAAGKVNSADPADYNKAQADIQAALDAVNASAEAQAQAAAAAQAAARAPSPVYRNGGSYAPSAPQYSAPAPAAPAAPSAPSGSGGDSSWREKLQNQQQVGGACNSAGVCGIG